MADGKPLTNVEFLKICAALAGIFSAAVAGLTYCEVPLPKLIGAQSNPAPKAEETSAKPKALAPETRPSAEAPAPAMPPKPTAPATPPPEGTEFSLETFEARNRVNFTGTGVSLFVPPEFKDLKITTRDTARLATADGGAVIYLEQSPLPDLASAADALKQIRQERALFYEFSRIDYEALRKSYLVMTGRSTDGEEFYDCTIVFEEEGALQMARFAIHYKGDAYDQAIESYMFDSFIGSIGVKRGG